MRLALHTDFSLRVLMYLAAADPEVYATTPMLAERFNVSAHHLQKVVQTLRKLGLVETVQGVGGGLRLAVAPETVRIGQTVAALESGGQLVDCARGPCPLLGACFLKSALDEAEQVLFQQLDHYTLADMITPKTGKVLRVLRRA